MATDADTTRDTDDESRQDAEATGRTADAEWQNFRIPAWMLAVRPQTSEPTTAPRISGYF